MNFTIRDIDAAVVRVLDERAKQKNLSRNTYLKQLLEAHVTISNTDDSFDKYERLVQLVLSALEESNHTITEISKLLEERSSSK